MAVKKICIFNLLLIMLVFLFSSKVFAEELVVDDTAVDITETSSTFTIKTPKRLVLEKDNITGGFKSNYNIEVSISNEADTGVSLVVRPRQETFELTAENKSNVIAYIEQEETEFSTVLQPDLVTGYATTGRVYTKEALSSAEWNGIFGFEIILQSAGIREEVKIATPSEATPSEAEEIIDEDELILDEEIIEDEITEATPSEATPSEGTAEESTAEESTTEESTTEESTEENGLEEGITGLENNPTLEGDVGQVTTEPDIDIGMQVDTEEVDVDIGEIIEEEANAEFTEIEGNKELETETGEVTIATPSEASI